LGTLALSPERQSAQMSEIKNGRLGLYGTEHSKCNHLITLGFKGLRPFSILGKQDLVSALSEMGQRVHKHEDDIPTTPIRPTPFK